MIFINLGQGKFSTVFKAETTEGVFVALKKIKVIKKKKLDFWYDGSKTKGEMFERS